MAYVRNIQNQIDELYLIERLRNNYQSDYVEDDDEDTELIDDCLAHVFLPKRSQSKLNLEKIENVLLETFTNSINNLLQECPNPELDSVQLMFEKWLLLQPTSHNWTQFDVSFPKEVASLQPGNTLPIYVRNQNCMLLIKKHMSSNHETISLSTFRCSLPSEMSMSNVQGDPRILIPETMEVILNVDMLKSQAFSKQLHDLTTGKSYLDIDFLNRTKKSDAPDPTLVTDWVVGLLVPQDLSCDNFDLPKNFQTLKKYRDQISLNENDQYANYYPFRRSGMYMALKGSLQLKLLESLKETNDQAKLVYKIFMLQILADFANQFTVKDVNGVDLGSQLLAKIGRRTQKLEIIYNEILIQSPSDWISNLKSKCIYNVSTIVDHLTRKMKSVWEIPTNITSENHLNLSAQEFEENLHHHLPELDKFVAKMQSSFNQPSLKNKAWAGLKESEVYSRYPEATSILKTIRNGQYKSHPYVWLHDTEYFIKFCCHVETIEPFHLSEILMEYTTLSISQYEHDPLGMSQIYLVSLKGFHILDQFVTKAYPLLLDYKPDVNRQLFDHLLLPHKKDIDLLNDLVIYFKNREENASLPGILSSSSICSSTFSVLNAQKNEEMKSLRDKILAETEAAIEEKYEQVKKTAEECDKLQLQHDELPCSCTYETVYAKVSKRKFGYKEVKTQTCEKCELPKIINSTRKSVQRYARPLPPEENLQWAVVFELMIPKNFAIFRNFLAFAKYELWGDTIFNGDKNQSSKLWLNYDRLFSYKNSTTNKKEICIHLASSIMPFTSKLNSKLGELDVFEDDPETFILNNGMTCSYFYNGKNQLLKHSISKNCSFQIATTENSESYSRSNLQPTLENTVHTQNSILARQNECHQNLTLEEFLAFGSLRAGHRIQLRNLYTFIVQGSLSLDHEAVSALILQTIWQIGPLNEHTGVRESHMDFSGNDTKFAEEFLDMLDKLVKSTQANYSNSTIILSSVLIIRRIGDINAVLQQKSYTVLASCRKILSLWVTQIEAALDKVETRQNILDVTSLSQILRVVVLSLALSYSISCPEDLMTVIKCQEDVLHWLQVLYLWNKLENEYINTSVFHKILWTFGKNIALCMQLENQADVLEDLIKKALKTFIAKNWGKATEYTCKSINFPYRNKNKGSLVIVEYLELDEETQVEGITHRVTFDFIQGRFKVNGYSSSDISLEIKGHKLFKMYFKDDTSLKVQQYSKKLTRTTVPFQGRQYEFHQDCFLGATTPTNTKKGKQKGKRHIHALDNDLVIQEIQDGNGTSSKLTLLDPQVFSNVFSSYFIENYSHWLDLNQELVYFRPISSSNDRRSDFTLQHVTTGEQMEMWTLAYLASGQYFLCSQSTWFKQIAKNLERLELEEYINITFNVNNQTATASLRRYNLRFTINLEENEKLLNSVEYPGYNVSTNQKCIRTLLGLQHGLLLEKGEKRLILMPHATISCSISDQNNISHQTSSILLSEKLRHPPCFVYEIDDVLQRLKAHNSKSAWLYLAALYAVTSSSFFPDPFTGLTGTEMAITILQSASVWSCSPYDEESIATLNFIRKLSPRRRWYDGCLHHSNKTEDKGTSETIKWPMGLPSILVYDGYAILVGKLIEDSERLAMLHEKTFPKTNRKEESIYNKPSEHLSLRGYLRNLPMYNLVATLEYPKYFTSSQIVLIKNQEDKTTHQLQLRVPSDKINILNMQNISFAMFSKSVEQFKESGVFQKDNLSEFLITSQSLDKANPPISLAYFELFKVNFRYSWLKLYNMAISCKSQEDIHLFTTIITSAAYCGAPMEQLLNLISIYIHTNMLENGDYPKPPLFFPSHYDERNFWCPSENKFDSDRTISILKQNAKPFSSLPHPKNPLYWYYTSSETKEHQDECKQYEKDLQEYEAQKVIYNRQVEEACVRLGEHFKASWPCKYISAESVPEELNDPNLEISHALRIINEKLESWYANYKLELFVKEVQDKLNKFWDDLDCSSKKTFDFTPLALQYKGTTVFVNRSTNIANGSENIELYFDTKKAKDLKQISKIFEIGQLENENNEQRQCYISQRNFYQRFVEKFKENLFDMLSSTNSSKLLHQTGLAPRLAPLCILKWLTPNNKSNELTNVLFLYAGALGVLWTQLKRINRCIRNRNKSDLQNERDNIGHTNWSPKEHPEWLLLELELDIMIRPIQVEVAKQMLKMPNGLNGVTQLNMGEGKTSVIVPMLCANLAQTDSQLCRITVINSMFKMNFHSLTFAIGGLLNKKVYIVPCRRDMKMDEECVDKIQQVFQECLQTEGVVLTLPEYRLSFRLLAYDKIYKSECILGKKMMDVENFLRNYARDVLDESDELFNVKYQLVYTIGEQVPIDGGDLRWKTCQKILNLIPKIGIKLLEKFGDGIIEFQKNDHNQNPHQFSTFRLLGKNTCLNELQDLVANSFLTELMISEQEKNIVKKFLIDERIELQDHEDILGKIFSDDNPDVLRQIVLLSGYLRRGILELALTKRWRVEYGVNPKPYFPRLMAIPFRAKDVAAEKTEFGHPDLAIILTHLSYYYSGLNEKQLYDVFHILKRVPGPNTIYSQWISKIPKEFVPESLENYCSLNMKDASQKTTLFKMLRKHKMVIDFWLSHCVFPRESKQFPGKLVMTAWDLCYERQRLAVTGFSGTNDSKDLLPLMITQQDLKQLEKTNELMTETLLQPENEMNHKGFPMGVTCQLILNTMKQDKLTVLIDAGALMLECSNEQVGNLWLEINPNIEAVVYFNENDELFVKTREDQKNGQGTPFELSTYQNRLEKCGVFLDDQHTRGTDLKFPVGTKACVTVATRMKRDKLIQACMRMRKLGQGHSVTFYLSHEARDKIKGDEITTKGVLDWVCENTEESNQDGLLYWAQAGRNYAQRLAAEDHFHFPYHQTPYLKTWDDSSELEVKAKVLANQCVDDEIVKLLDLYGQYTQMELLTELVKKWFNFTKRKLRQKKGEQRISPYILKNFDHTRDKIADLCLKMVPDRMSLSSKIGSMMEEELEKELELEIEVEKEEERNMERPAAAEPAIHNLHDNVTAIVLDGREISMDDECFVKLSQIFENTTFWDETQPESWKGNVFATKDFCSTITTNFQTDAYLRPIQFLISNKISSSTIQWLVISPFEANELLPLFQRSTDNTKCKLHMFSARRSEKQDLLLNNHRLQLPSATDLVANTVVLDPSPELASLLLASGNLYFASMQEQRAFTTYLGIFLQPWESNEKLAFEKGWITKSGFLLPQFRLPNQELGFQDDPTGLVKKILLCRHSSLSDVTHLMQLLNDKHYI